MSSNNCDSIQTLNHQLDALRTPISLPETEESWDTIARAITTLTALCNRGACDFESQLVNAIRSLHRPLNDAINSERSKLSGAALDLISTLASGLGTAFEPLLPLFFPTLLALCARTNRVFITRARTCIFAIIDATQSPVIITHFLQSLKDKAITLRLAASEGVLACMNCFNPPDLEKEAKAKEIEAVIRATARDANADVRKTSKKIFEAYKVLLPNRVQSFVDPLTPTMKKYLNIVSKPLVQANPHPVTKPTHKSLSDSKGKAKMSSSAPVLNREPSGHNPSFPERPTASSAGAPMAAGPSRGAGPAQPRVEAPTRETTKRKAEMPPPDYIPVRPLKRPATNSGESRAASSQPSRFLPTAAAVGTSGARRVNLAPPPIPSVPAPTIQATRVQRPVPQATKADRLLRSATGSRPGNSDGPVPGPSYVSTGARRVPISEAGPKTDRSERVNARRPNTRTGPSALPSRPESSTSTKSTQEKPKPPTVRPVKSTTALGVKSREPAKAASTSTRHPPKDANDGAKSKARVMPPATGGDGAVPRDEGKGKGKGTGKVPVPVTRGAHAPKKAEVPKPIWGRSVPRQVSGPTKPLSIKAKNPEARRKPAPQHKKEKGPSEPPQRTPSPRPTRSPLPPTPPPPAELPQPPPPGDVRPPGDARRTFVPPPLPTDVRIVGDQASYEAHLARVHEAIRNPPRVSPRGTPISTLLSSIERGFMFSPGGGGSPMSPAYRYGPRRAEYEAPLVEMSGEVEVPTIHMDGPGFGVDLSSDEDSWSVRKAGDSVVGGDESQNRLALSDVEINKRV